MQRRSLVRAGLAALSAAVVWPRVAPAATPATGSAAATAPASPPAPATEPAKAPAVVSDRRELTMVLAWSRATPGLGAAADRFAGMVAQLTDERVSIKVYGAGERVPAAETLAAVAGGTADFGHASSYFWTARNPALHFFGGVPFGLTAQEMVAWLRYGGGQALWEEVYRPLEIEPFYAGSTGVQAAGWFRREVAGLADLKGLKIRIPGLGAEVFKRLGAVPVMMPAAEIVPALTQGSLDAAEWIGPWNDDALGLPRAAKFYYLPGLLEPGPAIEIIANRAMFAKLSVEQQAAIRTSAAAVAIETLAEFAYRNATTLPRLIKEGTEVRRFSPEIVKAMARAAQQAVDDLAASDPLTKRVHASYQAFLQLSRAYAPLAEGGYLQERQSAFP
ncbi:MAG: TRAP transporter substrate-binding protein [Rhodospirillales bacterium]|nr:TRAP transporter substrate-binding protein [Rhodospirillales bacterium]